MFEDVYLLTEIVFVFITLSSASVMNNQCNLLERLQPVNGSLENLRLNAEIVTSHSVFMIHQCEDKCMRNKVCGAYNFLSRSGFKQQNNCKLLLYNGSVITEVAENFTYRILNWTLSYQLRQLQRFPCLTCNDREECISDPYSCERYYCKCKVNYLRDAKGTCSLRIPDAQDPSWSLNVATGRFGHAVNLRCKSTTSAKFKKATHVNEIQDDNINKYEQKKCDNETYCLKIKNLTQQDHGTYYCIAGGKRDAIELNLKVYIPLPKPNYDIKIGKEGIVPVVVRGAPRPLLVQWEKKVNGSYKQLLKLQNNILSGPQKTNGRMKIDPDKGYLIINNVIASDSGEYRIKASTDLEDFDKTTKVTAQKDDP